MAERRARQVRVAENVAAVLATALGVVPCFAWLTIANDRGDEDSPRPLQAGENALLVAALAVAVACIALALRALAAHLTRRAAAPLPAPRVDPLAHYREGLPPECPRHPFAR